MQAQNLNLDDLRVAVILPCYNEEQTIVKVINEIHNAIPDAVIHVFDNNSTDRTAELARTAGAMVSHVALKGKQGTVRAPPNRKANYPPIAMGFEFPKRSAASTWSNAR